MKKMPRTHSLSIIVLLLTLLLSLSCQRSNTKPPAGATKVPKVTQIDASGLKDLLKPKGRPLLINFWATWCGPCREEFPDLVEIGRNYEARIDLVTITLDDVAEIDGEVPKFLAQMQSESPAYLLKAADESAAISMVSKDWRGALPFTILFNAEGETMYSKQGKFNPEALVAAIENSL